jgi:hypothetical protein
MAAQWSVWDPKPMPAPILNLSRTCVPTLYEFSSCFLFRPDTCGSGRVVWRYFFFLSFKTKILIFVVILLCKKI